MRIALIAYDFPPLNSGGSQRPFLMAQVLADSGIEVTVFTLNHHCYQSDKLNFKINEAELNFKVVRTEIDRGSKKLNSSHYFNLVDNIAKRWKNNLINAIKDESKIKPFRLLLFTCPPFSLAKFAKNISKAVKIPFALDFRDAWSQWILSPYATKLHYKILLKIEKKSISKAEFVSSTSLQQILDFKTIHKTDFSNKFIYCPNGFMTYFNTGLINNNIFKSKSISIVYTGSFYFNPYSQSLQNKKWFEKKWYQWFQFLPRKEDWTYRSPLYFFKTLQMLLHQKNELKNSLEVIFAGEKPNWFDSMVGDFELQDVVKHIGFLDKDSTKRLISESDYLLITSSKVIGGKEYSVAGKTFEYFASKKPILSFVNAGEQLEILSKSNVSIIFNPDKVEANSKKLGEILSDRKNYNLQTAKIELFKIPNNFQILIDRIQGL